MTLCAAHKCTFDWHMLSRIWGFLRLDVHSQATFGNLVSISTPCNTRLWCDSKCKSTPPIRMGMKLLGRQTHIRTPGTSPRIVQGANQNIAVSEKVI